jgi:hypothetical protein
VHLALNISWVLYCLQIDFYYFPMQLFLVDLVIQIQCIFFKVGTEFFNTVWLNVIPQRNKKHSDKNFNAGT